MIFAIPEEHIRLRPTHHEDEWNYHSRDCAPPSTGRVEWINADGNTAQTWASGLSWNNPQHPVIWWRYVS